MSSAPWTLPRRSALRKRTSGCAAWMADAAATMPSADSARFGRPRTTVTGPRGQEVARGGEVGRIDATHLLGRGVGEQRSHDLARGTRSVQQRGGGELGRRCALRGQLDDGDAIADDGVAEAQEEDRQLLLEVGSEEQDGAAWGARPRRSWRAGRPSTTSAGSPSPSWASTWSVPMTPLASLAQA